MTQIAQEVKKWEDRTAGKSYIEGLNFSADRFWEKIKIEVTGHARRQKIDISVKYDGEEKTWHCEPDGGHTESQEYIIGKQTALNITGNLRISVVGPAQASIVATGYYQGDTFKHKSVSWEDETAGMSCINKLFLNEPHTWEKCEIKVEGKRNKKTGCMVSLLFDGAIALEPQWFVLNGTESKVITVDLHSKKGILLLPGYITHSVPSIAGGGAKVTLTGFYR